MRKLTPMIGVRFGKLTVTAEQPPKLRSNGRIRRYLMCVCDCGGNKRSSWDNLKSGAITHCGCDSIRHGGCGTKLYGLWHGVVQRCTDPNHAAYKNYGGRGVTLYPAWSDFAVFREWAFFAGYVEGLTIERIDNDVGYSPENCTWISRSQQAKNRRNNVRITYRNTEYIAADLAKHLGVNYTTLLYRMHNNLPLESINAIQKP